MDLNNVLTNTEEAINTSALPQDMSLSKMIRSLTMSKLKNMADEAYTGILRYAINIVLIILLLMIGFKIAKLVSKWVKKSFEKHNVDQGVVSFLTSFVKIGIDILFIFWAATILGATTSTIVAILGSAGVAIGLALQGSLANIAGGVLILMLRPFQVGDYIIEGTGKNEGTVVSVDIFYTRLKTIDNRIVVIPNGSITNCSLTNVTNQEKRRIDIEIGVEYSADLKKVKEILAQIIDQTEKAISEEPVDIFVARFDDSSIAMGIHFWVVTDDYWPVRWAVLEQIKEKFDENGINIPFNQLEVKVLS